MAPFVILVGEKGLSDEFKSGELSLRGFIQDYVEIADSIIHGYFEPLDDDLLAYGDDTMKALIACIAT